MCLEIYGLDPAHFFSTPGLAWKEALKMTKVKLYLLNDTDILLMVEKGIIGGVFHMQCFVSYVISICKANNKYMNDYEKNKESSYLKHWEVNNLYGRAML